MRKVVSVRLSDEEIAPLRRMAEERGLKLSDVIRSLLRPYVPTVTMSSGNGNGHYGPVTTTTSVGTGGSITWNQSQAS